MFKPTHIYESGLTTGAKLRGRWCRNMVYAHPIMGILTYTYIYIVTPKWVDHPQIDGKVNHEFDGDYYI
jgi:hypothetical protein